VANGELANRNERQAQSPLCRRPRAGRRRTAQRHAYNLVHLIYRPRSYEGDSKYYEFSRLSMTEHWRSGYDDAMRTLRHPEVLERAGNGEEFTIFDFTGEGD